MQKKLIALAVAGLASTAAFAQSNVTVYGVVDTYAGRFSGDGVNTTTAVNSGGLAGSRLGFKGVEDLGNGLKALFVLEYAIGNDTTTGPTTARQQMVGLTGGFGTAVAGRLQTAGYDFSADTNVLHGTAINPENSVTASQLITASSRANNAIAYISPNFSGFTVALNHARVTEQRYSGDADETTATLGSVKYANGPLLVTAIYDEIAGVAQGTTGSSTNVREWGLGGSYDFGVATVKANYISTKYKLTSGDDTTDKTWTISGAIPVTAAGTVAIGYAKNDIDADNANSASWTVAYLHSLSKRTTLYAGYQRVTNDDGANISVAGLEGLEAGGASTALVAGINHKF
jgi:predicted porin